VSAECMICKCKTTLENSAMLSVCRSCYGTHKDSGVEPPVERLVKCPELLADYAHEAWAGWMRYVFGICKLNGDESATIPRWAVERWTRQMETPYEMLSEKEKDSDRKEADKILKIIGT